MEETMDKLYMYLMTYGLNLLAAIIILVVGRWLARFVSRVIEKVMTKANIDKTLASFVQHLSYFALLAFVVIAALNKLGVETTSFVAIIGAAGLAVGFALQGSLSNFAAGVMIILFKPFKAGDFIEAGGAMGTIQEIQIFNTILNAPDNRRIIVPNSKITGDNVTNFTGIVNRRIDLTFGISYSDDIRKAKEALEKVVGADSRVLKEPAPVIAVSELGESSVNLVCRPWVKPTDYWGVYFDTLEKGKIALEAAGITIPFPQRDVHMYQEKAELREGVGV
ncbi:MAG: mechanosensitive ion channel [Candidatus Omnitrophica bacterium]|nr:mechanosensitive ion channel [Candidatus Omnitrophota bacterium]